MASDQGIRDIKRSHWYTVSTGRYLRYIQGLMECFNIEIESSQV